MSMPKIPDMNPEINITRDDAVNIVIASIAMEELALAHILNAEGEKLQYVLGTLNDRTPDDVTICDIMTVNKSIQKTLKDVVNAEILLEYKLVDAIELSESEDECRLTIKGQKIWRDGNNVYGTRPPSVRVNLLRDDVIYDYDTIDSNGDGRYTFKCLPVRNNEGVKYVYKVDEAETPAGYKKTIEGYNIINTAEPGVRSVDGTKIWDDNHDEAGERPATITVNLLQNSVQIKSTPVTSPPTGEDIARFSFPDVPRFDDKGVPYVYSVDEEKVEYYNKKISGFNITNEYIPEP